MNKEAFTKGLRCKNCGKDWEAEIPIGYITDTDADLRPLARKEVGPDIIHFTCPKCETKAKVRWA